MDKLSCLCLLVLLGCCVFAVSGVEEELVRVRRRVKPKPKKPLTLEELSYECQMHGWSSCRDTTEELFDVASNYSIDYRRCLTNAVLDRVSSISVDPLASLQVAQAVNDPGAPVPGDNEATTTENNQLPQTVEETSQTCTLDKGSKEEARDHYCVILSHITAVFVFNYMEDDLYNRGLEGLVDCIDYYSSDEIFTPQELLTSLKAWFNKMVTRHDCCEEKGDYPGLFTLPKGSKVYQCPANKLQATKKWDSLLSGVAILMKKVELLENLGRRRQCLRGCVGIDEVKCSNIIDTLL